MVLDRGGEAQASVGAPPAVLGDPSLDTPNCSACLHRMDADETAAGVPFWACGACGATRVA